MHDFKSDGKLNPNPKNPRFISPENFAALGRSLDTRGDLSPIIWNFKTEQLVGGHQRSKYLDVRLDDIQWIIELPEPDSVGDYKFGIFVNPKTNQKYFVRGVYWSQQQEEEALLAANNSINMQGSTLLDQMFENFDIETLENVFDKDTIDGLLSGFEEDLEGDADDGDFPEDDDSENYIVILSVPNIEDFRLLEAEILLIKERFPSLKIEFKE